MKSYCYKHLQLLEAKFNLHVLLNSNRELEVIKRIPHRDFYNVRKVDTHVHHSASMSQRQLLRFIVGKLHEDSDETVLVVNNVEMTLKEVFKSLNITTYDLSLDTLDMQVSLFLFECSFMITLIFSSRK